MYRNLVFIVFFTIFTVCVSGQSYEDKRCMCVCPSIAAVLNNTSGSDPKPYIANVPPNMCNCDEVILPRIADEIKDRAQEFCPRCECKYETRNTTIIKVVVIIVIWMIMLLVVYMGFLICLDPLINKRAKASYQEHTNEDVIVSPSGPGEPPGFIEAGDHKNLSCFDSEETNQHFNVGLTSPINDETSIGGPSQQMGVRGNVLNRVTQQQDKWKRQVREQRRNIYDRHTILN